MDSRDGGFKQDEQERRRKLWTGKLDGDLSFTLSNFFSPIANKDKYTGRQTSHRSLYVLLGKKWKMCRTPIPATEKISLKVRRKAAADASNTTQAKFINKTRGEGNWLTAETSKKFIYFYFQNQLKYYWIMDEEWTIKKKEWKTRNIEVSKCFHLIYWNLKIL